jgi:hypothetical protein
VPQSLRRYDRAMRSMPRIIAFAAFVLAFQAGTPASAQGQNTYGLSDLKPYDGAAVATPPPNGLASIMKAEKTPPPGNGKSIGEPVFTIHAVGGVMIDSTIRR